MEHTSDYPENDAQEGNDSPDNHSLRRQFTRRPNFTHFNLLLSVTMFVQLRVHFDYADLVSADRATIEHKDNNINALRCPLFWSK